MSIIAASVLLNAIRISKQYENIVHTEVCTPSQYKKYKNIATQATLQYAQYHRIVNTAIQKILQYK